MNIIQMSISAAILILIIVVVRSLAIHKLPKKTFTVLWGVALFRLLLPFYIPISLPSTAYTITDRVAEFGMSATISQPINPIIEVEASDINVLASEAPSLLMVLWITGVIFLILFFIITHLYRRRLYKMSLPVENDFINAWQNCNKLMRFIQIRKSDRIAAPMTYGILKPVILFPKATDWQDAAELRYVLTHELTHIRRFDVLTKWLLAAALCVHWFNPLVWVMYILASRDIEVACDETVVQAFGETEKSAYALALIGLEERRSGFSPLCNNFAKNAISERINVIMKTKKATPVGKTLALVLIFMLTFGTLTVFTAESELSVPNSADELIEVFGTMDSLRAKMILLSMEMSNATNMGTLGSQMGVLGSQMGELGRKVKDFANNQPVSRQDAMDIAMSFAGLTVEDNELHSFEVTDARPVWIYDTAVQSFGISDNRLVWEITFLNPTANYDVVIDAYTGEVYTSPRS